VALGELAGDDGRAVAERGLGGGEEDGEPPRGLEEDQRPRLARERTQPRVARPGARREEALEDEPVAEATGSAPSPPGARLLPDARFEAQRKW
jgi:hypothetical protein